jgi:hypothetical protein
MLIIYSILFARFFVRSYFNRGRATKQSKPAHRISQAAEDAAHGVGREVEAVGKAAEKHVDDFVNGMSKKINGSNTPQKRKNKSNANQWSVTPSNQDSPTKPNDTESQNELDKIENTELLQQEELVVVESKNDKTEKQQDGNGVYGVEENRKDLQASSVSEESVVKDIDKEEVHGAALYQEPEKSLQTPLRQESRLSQISTQSNDSTPSSQSISTTLPNLSPSVSTHRSQSPTRQSKIPKLNRVTSRIKKALSPPKAIITPSTTTTSTTTTSSSASTKGSVGSQKSGLGDAKAKGK